MCGLVLDLRLRDATGFWFHKGLDIPVVELLAVHVQMGVMHVVNAVFQMHDLVFVFVDYFIHGLPPV